MLDSYPVRAVYATPFGAPSLRRRAVAASERGHVLAGLSAANDRSWTARGSHGKWPRRAAIRQDLHVIAHGVPGMGMLGQAAETELSAGEAISGGFVTGQARGRAGMSLGVRPRGRPGERRDLLDLPTRAWRPAGRPALPGGVMLCFLLVGVRRPAGSLAPKASIPGVSRPAQPRHGGRQGRPA